jgi:hypothetical protein
MSTLLSLSAITRTKSNTVRMRGLCPTTMDSNENGCRSITMLAGTATAMPARFAAVFRAGAGRLSELRQSGKSALPEIRQCGDGCRVSRALPAFFHENSRAADRARPL